MTNIFSFFLNQICLRPSCGGNCQFRNENRQGDITIADFKGLTEVYPDLLGSEFNYSSIITNTNKGDELIAELRERMVIRECTVDVIKKYNPLFYRQTEFSKERNIFFDDFVVNSDDAIEKWTIPAEIAKESTKRRFYNMMPFSVRHYLARLTGRARV